MSNVTTVGIDLAKKLFSVHGLGAGAGAGAARALRLSQGLRGDRRQECTHSLGAAGPRGGAARGVTGTT